ncbi:MAG: restriction endonuclease [Pseudomonadota bacterium]|nr:restriction endonuclease [Pseudomonadota bacterium]
MVHKNNLTPEEYEILVKEFYNNILKQEKYENIDVKHNVKIKGESGATHQIDVYWEYWMAGVKKIVCIECKNWRKKVEKGHISSFIAVLNDIGPVNGIYVTTRGYQSGAKRMAKNKMQLLVANPETRKYESSLKFVHSKVVDAEFYYEVDLPIEVQRELAKHFSCQDHNCMYYDHSIDAYISQNEFENYLVREFSGRYTEDISNISLCLKEEMYRCKRVSYNIVCQEFPHLTLKGITEVVELVTEEILSVLPGHI